MKHLIYIALFFIGMQSMVAQSADLQARTHYLEAEAAYQSKNYSKTLTSLEETVKLLKKTNARIETLRIKTYTDMGNISEARKSLTVFSGFNADYSLYQELNPYIERIEQAEQKQFEAEQQTLQQEAEKQERQFRVQELLGQVMAKIEEDKLDDATSLLTRAKQMNTDTGGKESISQVETYLNEIKDEKALYQSAISGNVEQLRAYLRKFSKHDNATKITQLLQEKEEQAYNKAISTDKTEDYEYFLRDFAESNKAGEIKQLLTIAQEKNAYLLFTSNRTSEKAHAYLQKFPQGVNRNEVTTAYEELLFTEGVSLEKADEYSLAKEKYILYKSTFPNGKNSSQVNKKLNQIDKKIAKQSKINEIDRKTYVLLSYATNGTYGIELGNLPANRKLGMYIAGQFNGPGLKIGKSTGTITQEELDVNSDLYEVGILAGSLGFNYCITYPLWVYAGVVVSSQPYYYEKLDQSLTLEGRKNLAIFPEFGIKSNLGKVVLKIGVQMNPDQTAFQFGIGF